MKTVVFTRKGDQKRFELQVEDELCELIRDTCKYLDKMKAVVEAAPLLLKSIR